MYRHLPRHTFGYIQSKLFPKYFLLGTILSTITLITFVVEHPFSKWDRQQTIQAGTLGLVLLSTLANVVYLTPRTIHVTFEKHRFEKEIQAGQAVGKVEDNKVEMLNKNKEYVSLSKEFVLLHSLASIANLLSLCAQGVHAIYLAGHLVTL